MRPDAQGRCIMSLLSGVTSHPAIILLHIGENDVLQMSPSDISAAIIAATEYMSAVCHPAVIICTELFPAPGLCGNANPNDVVGPVNYHVRQSVAAHPMTQAGTRLVYWRFELGMWNPAVNLYLRDRIHLNEDAMPRYWASVRAAVKTQLRLLGVQF